MACTESSIIIDAGGATEPYAASRTRGSGSLSKGIVLASAKVRSSVSPSADAAAARRRQSALFAHCASCAGRKPARAADASRDARYAVAVSRNQSVSKSVLVDVRADTRLG